MSHKLLTPRVLDILQLRSNLTEQQRLNLIGVLRKQGVDLTEVLRVVGGQRLAPRVGPRERVGTELKKLIEGLLHVKSQTSCKCTALATQMDGWGISGCEQRRATIIAQLVSNRDMLTEALRTHGTLGHAAGLAIEFVPEIMLRSGAGLLLDAAIANARAATPIPKPIARPRIRRHPQTPRQPRQPTAAGMLRFRQKLKDEQDRLYAAVRQAPPPQPDPFIGEPVLHFGAHLWPVRGHWEWHADRWNEVAAMVNGRCIVGIATDAGTATVDEVRSRLDRKFEIHEFANEGEGENQTFRMLQQQIPGGQDDVLIYCHGKGVRAHTAASEAVRCWTDLMYEAVVFNHDVIRDRLAAGYANVHSFRTFGTRPLSPKHKWHPSGTFFAVRAKHLAGKPVKARYGGVEAWCGDHFPAAESWCEFGDNSMFTIMYDLGAIYETHVDPGMDWEAARIGAPRCEQHKRELDWFIESLNPTDRILVIGSKHGGIEAAIKRRLPDVTTVSIDIDPQPDNVTTDLVIGSSHDPSVATAARSQGPFDVVFIDGDHSYDGVREDYWFAHTCNPRMIALHDIHDTHKHRSCGCEVNRLWAEIKQSGRQTDEKIIGCGWGGIGLVWRDRDENRT